MSLSINTNMSSIRTQNAFTKATDKLNRAIEQMTTGYKINSASDDAAGYSIAKNMDAEISSYEVAQQNVAMGNSLISTASGSLDLLTSHIQRIKDLCEQGANGTYSDDNRKAMQDEIDQRLAEIDRIIETTEYNGIKLFTCGTKEALLKQKGLDNIANIKANKGPNGKFISDVTTVTPDVIVSDPTQLLTAIENNTKIGISNAETLAQLATIVNSGTNNCSGKTILLTEDIDLSAYQSGTGWAPIGTEANPFRGTFDGNGHVISNLYINNPTADCQGLFISAGSSIKNLGVENCNVTGKNYVSALLGVDGINHGNTLTNCYSTGTVTGNECVGGISAETYVSIINSCYSTCNVTGNISVGGLVGEHYAANITNCFATGDVSGTTNIGGLVGHKWYGAPINNSYATGDVSGTNNIGGLLGNNQYPEPITNCYATGDVSGSTNIGGLVGGSSDTLTISSSYAAGNVSGTTNIGGFIGNNHTIGATITNCVTLSDSIAGSTTVGSFAGINNGTCTDCATTNEDAPLVGSGNGSGISLYKLGNKINLQVGITSSNNSKITIDTAFSIGEITIDVSNTYSARAGLDTTDELISTITQKQTEFGSIQNRLDSISESIEVSMDNLTFSKSTIKDADIAEASSEYIKNQILQEACATMLTTANQTPSIALQLI